MTIRTGTAGNDNLRDEAAGDQLVGGRGDDYYDILFPGTRIVEAAGEGEEYVDARIDFTLPDHVEHLTLIYDYRDGPVPNPVPDGHWAHVGIGNALDNVIRGNVADNRLLGEGGDDVLVGGGGNDTLAGGDDHDILTGNEGADSLQGNAGNDLLRAGKGNDTLYGGRGEDQLYGDLGDDVLSGDRGDDVLFGGAGADRFLFGPGSGLDVVMDFSAAEGDRIVLPRDVAWTMRSAGSDIVIDVGTGIVADPAGAASITLRGAGGTFSAAWIEFA